MRRLIIAAALCGLASILIAPVSAEAGSRAHRAEAAPGGAHPKSTYYRGGPRVKGFIARRGGYSYSAPDAINTYGDARTRFGGNSAYRDPFLDRQTNAGPFDHGFFFDSGIAPRGGDSPYMN